MENLNKKLKTLKMIRDDKVKILLDACTAECDDLIREALPFKLGDMLTDTMNCKSRYFIYDGVKNKCMLLIACTKDGEILPQIQWREYIWTEYDTFNIYKEAKTLNTEEVK